MAHGWDIPAWWPLDASTWMLGIIPYSVFLSYMVRWVASSGRIADSHLQNFSPSVSVQGCCVCRRLFVLFVCVISCVRREGRIQWRTLISFSMGFLDKDKAPLFLPPPCTRGISLEAVIERTTLDRRQALRPKFSVWPVRVSSCFRKMPELIIVLFIH